MKEIPITQLLKTLTLKRLVNAAASVSGFLLSTVLKRSIIWGKPFVLSMEPTNYCNLRCPLCITGNNSMTRSSGNMSLDTFKKVIDELGDYLFYLLLYQQGEPYLNKEFLGFVRFAKARRIFVTTSTNGHYLDKQQAAETVASGMDSMIVSIDGTDQATYSKYRVNGKLDKVLAGVRNIVSEKKYQKSKTPVVYLQFIAMKQNEHQIREIHEICNNIGADHLLIKTVFVDSADEARAWLPDNEAYRRYNLEGKEMIVKRSANGPCHRPWTSSLINWDGTTVPCCFDKDAGHTCGNTDTALSFEDIWKSGYYADFRNQMLSDRKEIDICANCSQGLRLFR